MIMNINKTLIRLYDAKNDNMISAFYTDNPSEFLKTYYFCKENDISINIPHDLDNENYKYNHLTAGTIMEIEVGFGGTGGTVPHVDVWLEDIY